MRVKFILFFVSLMLILSPKLMAKDIYNIAFIGNSTNAVSATLFNTAELVWEEFNNSNSDAEIKGIYVNVTPGSNQTEEIKNIPNLLAVAGNLNESHKPLMGALKETPFISIASGELVPEQNEEYTIFRMCPGEISQSETLARFIMFTLERRTFAVIYQEGAPEYLKMAVAFGNMVKQNKRQMLYYKGVGKDQTDFEPILLRLRDMKIGVIFYAGDFVQATALAKQAYAMKLGALFASTDEINRPYFIGKGGRAAEGSVTTSVSPPFERMKKFRPFIGKFRKKFGAPDLHMPYDYDMANMIVAYVSLTKTGSPTVGLTQYLKETVFEGILGKVSFDAKGFRKEDKSYIYIVAKKAFIHRKIGGEDKEYSK
ncbi:MAG: ABC transporter substrate-binding protein [bacterium]